MQIIKGNPVSPGIASAAVYIYRPATENVQESYIEPGTGPEAVQEYEQMKDAAAHEINDIITGFGPGREDSAEAAILRAHLEILEDEELDEGIRELISRESYSPAYAIQTVFDQYIQVLGAVEDTIIAGRTADLKDVRNRLLRAGRGESCGSLSSLDKPVILIAHDLLPSDTASMDKTHVAGIITETGGATSHTAILAKSYRIPALLGVPEALNRIKDGSMLILDALKGEAVIDPDQNTIELYSIRRAVYLADSADAEKYLQAEPLLKDGTRMNIGINIGSAEPDGAYENYDFIGLFRTEFLYMGSDHMPTEEEQFNAYKKVLLMAKERSVTLRTLDIGGDKTLSYFKLPEEQNPFLGKRAIRLCLDNPDLFRTQIRAALRASVYGNLKIMFPMIGSLDDLRAAKATVKQCMQELSSEGIPYSEDVPLGIMIEIPSIALIADLAAKEADFASIGTNDLTQYICAADRMNPEVSDYYQTFSPALLRTVGNIIRAFNAEGRHVSMCGELAGNPLAAPILAGLGLKNYSMNPVQIAVVKRALAGITMEEAVQIADRCLSCATEAEVLEVLGKR